jgi:phospholipid/cholesterol/gamma-HCH transport system substrate-binding protein
LKLSRELKTGLVTAIIIALFFWGYNFMKGQNIFDTSPRTYFAKYSNIGGLSTASNVTINGMKVGKIVDITFDRDPESRGMLIVEFGVNNDFKFSKNSIATIYSASLMGGKALSIDASFEGEEALSGDLLAGKVERDMFTSLGETINPVQVKLERVLESADSLLNGLNSVLNKEGRRNLSETISGLNETVSGFKNASVSLNNVINENKDELSSSISNLAVTTENFAKLSDSLVSINIVGTVDALRESITRFGVIMEGIEQGEGSVGKLLKDDGLYINLENASKELEELLREIKEHPRRFVNISIFGKKDKGYQEKEE